MLRVPRHMSASLPMCHVRAKIDVMSSLPTFPFGALLRRHRLRTGLTQEALAGRARLSTEAISTLERGTRRAPRAATIDLLADALSLSPAERVHLHRVARGQAASAAAGHVSR